MLELLVIFFGVLTAFGVIGLILNYLEERWKNLGH